VETEKKMQLDNLLRHADLVSFIKSQRLSWLGHVKRMAENRMPEKIKEDKIHGTKKDR
jgi:hypothetical protein